MALGARKSRLFQPTWTLGIFIILANGAFALPGYEPNITCPELFELHGKNCLRVATSDRKWGSAVAKCKTFGGRLFEPRSKEDIEAVRPRLAKGLYWIGISDTLTEGRYVYNSSGLAISYADWMPNQPDNDLKEDCVLMFMLNGPDSPTFRNAKCQVRHRYICQVTPRNDCHERNTLFLERSIKAASMTACKSLCENIASCKFVNYNSQGQLCGIRSYRPSNLVHSLNQLTSTRTYTVPGQNQAMVGYAEETDDENQCQRSCQMNPHCKSWMYNMPISQNPSVCIHNYGESEEQVDLSPQLPVGLTLVVSGPKFCGPNIPIIDYEEKFKFV